MTDPTPEIPDWLAEHARFAGGVVDLHDPVIRERWPSLVAVHDKLVAEGRATPTETEAAEAALVRAAVGEDFARPTATMREALAQRARELHACERCRTVFHGETLPALVLYPSTRIELEVGGRVVTAGEAGSILHRTAEAAKLHEQEAAARVRTARALGEFVGGLSVATVILAILCIFAALAWTIGTATAIDAGAVAGYVAVVALGWYFVPPARPRLRVSLHNVIAGLVGCGALWAVADDPAHASDVAVIGAVLVGLATAALLYLHRRSRRA